MTVFSVKKAAEGSGLSNEEIRAIAAEVRKEFPHDEMLFELHMVRAISEAARAKRRSKKKIS